MRITSVYYLVMFLGLIACLFCPYPLSAWGVLINSLTFLLYWVDKLAARKNRMRVPETTLLIFGLAGGWIGSLAAQQLFRHKTQKQPFRTRFMLSVILNIVVILMMTYYSAVFYSFCIV